MIKHFFRMILVCSLMLMFWSCDNDEFNKDQKDATDVEVDYISSEMQTVRNYVPMHAIVAHRGSTFWVPEETEAAYRWAREIGSDYLEADLQVSKDGVVLALHDDDLRRTTNIDIVYGGTLPSTRLQYYLDIGYTQDEAELLVKHDRENFMPYYANFYTYSELLALDAGSWFNEDNPEQARSGFTTNKQYISSLEDLVQYSRGMKLKRDANNERVWKIVGKTGKKISGLSGESDIVKYEFEYVLDNEGNSGHKPGIYIEFKEPWLNPAGFEQMVYDELDRLGMNIISSPEPESNPFYTDGLVNVGNTNGKVILQTFSLESLKLISEIFKGQVPMCFLFWYGTGPTDISNDSPLGYASYINLGLEYKAHIIGPCIAGAPNNYPELNAPWQAYLIKKAGMLNHPYSFDSIDQMKKYFGDYNFGNDIGFESPYVDGMFTNRAEMTLQFYIDKGIRDSKSPQIVPNSMQLLDKLGYTK